MAWKTRTKAKPAEVQYSTPYAEALLAVTKSPSRVTEKDRNDVRAFLESVYQKGSGSRVQHFETMLNMASAMLADAKKPSSRGEQRSYEKHKKRVVEAQLLSKHLAQIPPALERFVSGTKIPRRLKRATVLYVERWAIQAQSERELYEFSTGFFTALFA